MADYLIGFSGEDEIQSDTPVTVTSVVVTLLEGAADECDNPVTCATINEANEQLRRWALNASAQGYDKSRFTVNFSDGSVYAGRFDLMRKHHAIGVDLKAQMISFVKWCGANPQYSSVSADDVAKSLKFYETL